MRALSILQPWAWLIVNGHKDIENRKWSTNYRGRFLIHAGKRWSNEQINDREDVRERFPEIGFPDREQRVGFDHGGIVGEAEIIDCVQTSDSPWFCGPNGFVIANARPLPFTPWRGQLGWFDVPESELVKP